MVYLIYGSCSCKGRPPQMFWDSLKLSRIQLSFAWLGLLTADFEFPLPFSLICWFYCHPQNHTISSLFRIPWPFSKWLETCLWVWYIFCRHPKVVVIAPCSINLIVSSTSFNCSELSRFYSCHNYLLNQL